MNPIFNLGMIDVLVEERQRELMQAREYHGMDVRPLRQRIGRMLVHLGSRLSQEAELDTRR